MHSTAVSSVANSITNKRERKESATPSEGGMSEKKLKQEERDASKHTGKALGKIWKK